MAGTTIKKKVNFGSGFVYVKKKDADFPTDLSLSKVKAYLSTKLIDNTNRIGNIKGGFNLDVTTDTLSDKDDMGELRIDDIIGENGTMDYSLFDYNSQTIEKIYPMAANETDEEGWSATAVGGISNKDDSEYVVAFLHKSVKDGDTVIFSVGKNMQGISEAYTADGVSLLPVKNNLQSMDDTGRLFMHIDAPAGYEWPLLKAGSQASNTEDQTDKSQTENTAGDASEDTKGSGT